MRIVHHIGKKIFPLDINHGKFGRPNTACHLLGKLHLTSKLLGIT